MTLLLSAETILANGPRYRGGLWADRHVHWSAVDQAALFALCGAKANIEQSADVLARPPKTLCYRALDSRIKLPKEWWRFCLSPREWERRQDVLKRRAERRAKKAAELAERKAARPRPGLMQYPYVAKADDRVVDLLTINEIVPKHLPEWMRADVCQEIMLAILEGKTSIAALKDDRKKLNKFIRLFRDDDKITSFDMRDEKRAYDEIAASLSPDLWDWQQVNDRKLAYDTLGTITHPDQIGAVYEAELRLAQATAHGVGEYLSLDEIENELSADTPAVSSGGSPK